MTRLLSTFLFVGTIAVPALQAQNGGNGASANPGSGLNGTWLIRGGRGQTQYPQSQWFPGELPFTPAGKTAFDRNKSGKGPRQVPPAFGNDPLSNANPPGLYRALIYSRPVEMFTMPGKVVQLFEWSKFWRVIYTDGRTAPKDVPQGPFWYGYSVGHWEGDTFLVTTVALDGRAWLDEWGTPFTDNARVEERWRRTAPDKVELTITVNDPMYYTKSWTSDSKIFNADKEELFEVVFAPMDEAVFNERIRNPAGGLKK